MLIGIKRIKLFTLTLKRKKQKELLSVMGFQHQVNIRGHKPKRIYSFTWNRKQAQWPGGGRGEKPYSATKIKMMEWNPFLVLLRGEGKIEPWSFGSPSRCFNGRPPWWRARKRQNMGEDKKKEESEKEIEDWNFAFWFTLFWNKFVQSFFILSFFLSFKQKRIKNKTNSS